MPSTLKSKHVVTASFAVYSDRAGLRVEQYGGSHDRCLRRISDNQNRSVSVSGHQIPARTADTTEGRARWTPGPGSAHIGPFGSAKEKTDRTWGERWVNIKNS